jgi:hypothetical protein
MLVRGAPSRKAVLLVVAVALLACDENTDATLGECVEPTTEWWPLRPGVVWNYEQLELSLDTVTEKRLVVEYDRAQIHGLLGDETGVRTWRADVDRGAVSPFEAGWRFFTATAARFGFRRDVWVGADTMAAPCDLEPDEDVAQCEGAPVFSDTTYFPMRVRLDLTPNRLCERSAWSSPYVRTTIEVEVGDLDDESLVNCSLEDWRRDPLGCPSLDREVTDQWEVQSVDETIDVPAGHFENCLCVRRISSDHRSDQTYCFAKGIGKVYELDRPDHVECLADYRIDADTWGPRDGPEHGCDENQIEW